MRMLVLFALLWAACANATESAPEASNPLAGLPSSPGPHLEKIKALGEDAWLDLGSPAPDPKWGKSRGRAYSPKAAFAPDLNGAFYCATGAHGFVKPDGHFMDDLYFYDANAHRWICLYPGASKETKLRLDEHGFERTLEGDANPVSYLSHAYNMLTYNPKLRRFMIINHPSPWWTKALPQRADWLEVAEQDRGNPYRAGKLNGSPKHPIFWSVDGNKWERIFVEDKVDPGKDLGVLEYLPDREQAFYMAGGKAWFYDFKDSKWIDANARVGAKIVYDYVGCYDAQRGKIYILDDKNLFGYDLKANAWTTLEPAPASFGNSTLGQLDFDTASGMVIGFSFAAGKEGQPRGAFVYDPDRNAWSPPVSEMPKLRGPTSCFYHPERNAHFIYTAGDSRDDGTMLVYRYKHVKK
ncbi:MAG: hypothetical protein HS116_02670 [Planctomycetes bacterium]|nr:hypothetical protein [Planctomycetota bacterium]